MSQSSYSRPSPCWACKVPVSVAGYARVSHERGRVHIAALRGLGRNVEARRLESEAAVIAKNKQARREQMARRKAQG